MPHTLRTRPVAGMIAQKPCKIKGKKATIRYPQANFLKKSVDLRFMFAILRVFVRFRDSAASTEAARKLWITVIMLCP
jgi:hypothetical protein